MLFWLYCPLEDDLFDVVIEDLRGVSPEILEGMQMALDEGIDIRGKGEFHVPHAEIAEDHTETVEPSWLTIHVDTIAFSPVHLSLDSGFGLIPKYCRCSSSRTDLSDVFLDNCVPSGEPLFLDLAMDSCCTQGVF